MKCFRQISLKYVEDKIRWIVMIKRSINEPFLLILAFLAPAAAFANAAIPLVAPTFVSAVVLLVPVTLLEASFYMRHFKVELKKCVWISLRANVYSTLVGIPLVVITRAAVAFVVAFGLSKICQDCQLPKPIQDGLFLFSQAVSGIGLPRPKHEKDWIDTASWALAVLEFVIAYFVSVYWERRTLTKAFPDKSKLDLTKASYMANAIGYLMLLIAMATGVGALIGLNP